MQVLKGTLGKTSAGDQMGVIVNEKGGGSSLGFENGNVHCHGFLILEYLFLFAVKLLSFYSYFDKYTTRPHLLLQRYIILSRETDRRR